MQQNINSTVVFLGPTLSLKQAQDVLPEAYYFPPARCGDVLRALRLKPVNIAIIDGFFEKTAAIWHKEILFALEKGVRVFGASSMGALRARELQYFGMVGVGQVFTQYNRHLQEDDAVAILHGPTETFYLPQTTALVNIWASIHYAEHILKIIDHDTAQYLKIGSEKLYYPERSLENIFKQASAMGAEQKYLQAFSMWQQKNGWLDVKKTDALALLTLLQKKQICSQSSIKMARSSFFRAHYKHVMCRPYPQDDPMLPIAERVAFQMLDKGIIYRQAKRCAYLLAACHALANQQSQELGGASRHSFELNIDEKNTYAAEVSADKIYGRFAQIKKLFYNTLPITRDTPQDYLNYLLKLSLTKEYQQSRQKITALAVDTESVKYRLFSLTASLWWLVEQHMEAKKLIPQAHVIQKASDKFRFQQQLFTEETTADWLKANDLSLKEYSRLMLLSARFNYLIMQNNLDALEVIDQVEDVWWFLDAIYLSGFYQILRAKLE